MVDEAADREPAPKLLGTWLTLQQAELMLQHVAAAGATWPEAAIYLHSCITAIRSVTFTMQHELAHEPGFKDWYEPRQQELADDPEMAYLKEARNHVLKRGSLHVMHAYGFKYDGPLGISVHGFGPDGPDVRVRDPGNPEEEIPVDWRKLEGFEFEIPLRLGALDGLPEPPEKEAKALLMEKIGLLRLLVLDAEEKFDPACFDPEEAGEQRRILSSLRSSGSTPQTETRQPEDSSS
jgi:hypothetical protein